jgi:hypothetical protein
LRADAENERFQGGLYSILEGLRPVSQNLVTRTDQCGNFYLLNEELNMNVVQSAEITEARGPGGTDDDEDDDGYGETPIPRGSLTGEYGRGGGGQMS